MLSPLKIKLILDKDKCFSYSSRK